MHGESTINMVNVCDYMQGFLEYYQDMTYPQGSCKSERETQIKFSILSKPMENVISSTPTKIQENNYKNRRKNNVFML